MRKTFLRFGILAAGAMLLLSSCDKKEEGLNIDNKPRNEFMATIQQCEADDNIETKTYTDDGRRVLWRVSDVVSILQGRDLNEIFKVKEILKEGTSVVLEKAGNEVASPTTFDANIAYYPYFANMKYVGDNTNHAISVKIPSTQTYKENSFGLGALPMVAVTKSKLDYDFEFKNLFGFLKLKLNTKDIMYDIVDKIIIRGNNNEKICGEAIVKCSSNGEPTIEFSDKAGTEIVLNCSNKRICTPATDFWIALPPITFTKGIAVEIVTLGNSTTKRQSSAPLTINRSKIKPMEVITFTELSYVPIPDKNFRKYLLGIFDKNNDGHISFPEVDRWNNNYNEKSFALSEYITSLDGIEYFTALTKLSCEYNRLTSLDLSKNTALTKLGCMHNQLTSLDVGKNTALTWLECNENQLTSLDLSGCTALTKLDCDKNQLTSLDLSGCTALTDLSCYSNQLTSLDLSNKTALIRLYCDNNQLTSLDLSNKTALIRLYCDNNQLTSLDVSNNTALTDLICDKNQLTTLDVSNNTALTNLSCSSNQLTSLDVSNNTALTSLRCRNNQLTSLDLSNNTALAWWLYCDNNQLTSLDLSNNTALIRLNCFNNKLTSLDLSNNTALTWLDCNDNQLTSLDLSNNTALTYLDCDKNQLTTLDVSNNTALIWLKCYNNQLTSIDVTNNTALKELYCYGNQLTSLDVSKNTSLTNLGCFNNKLTSLDLSNNTALTYLKCDMPSLKTLYLKKGHSINGITYNRSTNYINKNTEIVFVD